MVETSSQGDWKQVGGILGGRNHFQILCGDEGGEGIGKFRYHRGVIWWNVTQTSMHHFS